jgi:hypothetical protein
MNILARCSKFGFALIMCKALIPSDRLRKLFCFSALIPSVKPLGLIDVNDCTNRNA